MKWLPWIRICIGNMISGSGFWTVKIKSKKEKNLRFQVEKSIDHFAVRLMDFTLAYTVKVVVEKLKHVFRG